MTPHDHATFTPGCYRCELGRDEAMSALVDERDELEAEVDRLREALREIRDADPVDMTLDPGWAARIARAASDDQEAR